MPQIANKPAETAATWAEPATRTLVYVKEHWSDDWTLAKRSRPPSKKERRVADRDGKLPHVGTVPVIDGVIRAMSWERFAWPSIGTAQLKYQCGESVALEDETEWRVVRPENLVGWYVKIVELVDSARTPLGAPLPGAGPLATAEDTAWVGMFTERMFDITPSEPEEGADRRTAPQRGDVTIVAHELSFLLARHFLATSWWNVAGDVMQAVDAVPALNRPWGKDIGAGNRSEERAKWADSYVFGKGARWTVYDFLEYILANHVGGAPSAASQRMTGTNASQRFVPDFVLAGPAAEDLRHIEAAGRFEGQSLFAIIEALLPRNKGFGLRVETAGKSDSKVELVIYSTLDATLTGPAGQTYTANQSTMTIKLDDDEAFSDVVIRASAATQFDTIVVRGAPITVTATFSKADETAEAGWEDALATECLLATEDAGDLPRGMTRQQVDDEFRQADKYRGVFSTLRVPDTWRRDPKTSDSRDVALASKAFYTFLPALDSQAMIVWDSGDAVGAELASPYLVFEHLTELLTGVDYTSHDWGGDGPTISEDAELERIPLLAWIGREVDSGGDTDGRYYSPLELIPKAIVGGDRDEGCSIYPLRHDLGIRIEMGICHLLARDECAIFANGISSERYTLPTLSWEDVGWTGTVRTERHLSISEYITPVGDDCGRVKIINVPSARFDYCVPGTVVGVENGKLLTLPASNSVLRDDSGLLRWIAWLAKEYYAKPRYTVQLCRRDPRMRPTVGTMLTTVSSANQLQDVNTVVSAVRVSYAEGNEGVTIETAQNELDFA